MTRPARPWAAAARSRCRSKGAGPGRSWPSSTPPARDTPAPAGRAARHLGRGRLPDADQDEPPRQPFIERLHQPRAGMKPGCGRHVQLGGQQHIPLGSGNPGRGRRRRLSHRRPTAQRVQRWPASLLGPGTRRTDRRPGRWPCAAATRPRPQQTVSVPSPPFVRDRARPDMPAGCERLAQPPVRVRLVTAEETRHPHRAVKPVGMEAGRHCRARCLVGRFHAHVHLRVTPRPGAVRSVPGETREDNYGQEDHADLSPEPCHRADAARGSLRRDCHRQPGPAGTSSTQSGIGVLLESLGLTEGGLTEDMGSNP